MHQTCIMFDFVLCAECEYNNLEFFTDFNFAAKNENLTRSKEQQSAEHTAEQNCMEGIICCSRWQGVLLFHWCLLGVSRCIHHAKKLLSASRAHNAAPMDWALGATGREWHRGIYTLCVGKDRYWFRCGCMHRWWRCNVWNCCRNVPYWEWLAGHNHGCWERMATGVLLKMLLNPF